MKNLKPQKFMYKTHFLLQHNIVGVVMGVVLKEVYLDYLFRMYLYIIITNTAHSVQNQKNMQRFRIFFAIIYSQSL